MKYETELTNGIFQSMIHGLVFEGSRLLLHVPEGVRDKIECPRILSDMQKCFGWVTKPATISATNLMAIPRVSFCYVSLYSI